MRPVCKISFWKLTPRELKEWPIDRHYPFHENLPGGSCTEWLVICLNQDFPCSLAILHFRFLLAIIPENEGPFQTTIHRWKANLYSFQTRYHACKSRACTRSYGEKISIPFFCGAPCTIIVQGVSSKLSGFNSIALIYFVLGTERIT